MSDSENIKHSYLVTPLPVSSDEINANTEPKTTSDNNGIWISRKKIKELNSFIRTARKLKEKHKNLKDDYRALQDQYDLKKIDEYVIKLKGLNFEDNSDALQLIKKIETHLASIIKE